MSNGRLTDGHSWANSRVDAPSSTMWTRPSVVLTFCWRLRIAERLKEFSALRGLSWDTYLTAQLEVVSTVRENLPTPNSRGGSDSRFPEQFWNVISTSPVEQGFTADCGRFLAQRPDSEEKGQAAVCPLSSPSDGGSFPTTSQLFPGRVHVVVPSGLFLDLPQDVLAQALLDQSGQ